MIRPGELQWMSAGHGVRHSEFNGSRTEPVHFLQIWLQPDRVNATPAYAQRAATGGDGWQLLASPDGRDGSLAIRQDALVRNARPAADTAVDLVLDPGRRYWLQVAQGTVEANGRALAAGDALGFEGESGPLQVTARGNGADVLLFDLPA